MNLIKFVTSNSVKKKIVPDGLLKSFFSTFLFAYICFIIMQKQQNSKAAK